jgi:lipopolysaccharide/colanic/teichoic acid biosynthesis glycosyltransferase
MRTTSQTYTGNEQSNYSKYTPKPGYELAKRATETSLALVVLLGLAPLWLVVVLAIKLTSKGPVFFRGRVVGRHGREFTYYKFRSMRHNSDNSQHRKFINDYVRQNLAGVATTPGTAPRSETGEPPHDYATAQTPPKPQYKLTNDSRVTPVGRIIRKLSIDEVPQMINVIRGEMAIVGPRPPVPYEYSLYDDWCKQRLAVLPGITGLAQVRMRGTARFRQMVELDLEYIETRSYWSDWKIMLKTPYAMLKGA